MSALNCEIDCKVGDCNTMQIAVSENTDVKKTTGKTYWSTTSSPETGVLLITELYNIVLYLYQLNIVGIYKK